MKEPTIAYGLAIFFAFYASVTRDKLTKIKKSLPDNIRKIYLGEGK